MTISHSILGNAVNDKDKEVYILKCCYFASGVSSLRALLAREKDEDCPRLNVLLCESLVAVYMSLLIHALSMYDANILYRLAGHTFTHTMWPTLFGGGVRKLVKLPPSPDVHRSKQHLVLGPPSQDGYRSKNKFVTNIFKLPGERGANASFGCGNNYMYLH